MKKLMLAAAIVCAAVAAQAQINMGVDICGLTAPSSFNVKSKCCDMYAYKTDPTQSQFVSGNLAWGDAEWVSAYVFWEGGTGSATDYNYYWVLTYTLSDGSTKTLSTLGSGLQYDISGSFIDNESYYPAWQVYTKDASQWKGGEVPEPTSAMLMLLGVAGLALKRKQK